MPNIKEIALKVANEYDKREIYFPYRDDLVNFAEALVAELAKGNEPVAWMYEYSYDLNGDKQGNWPVEMHTNVSFSRSKPSVDATPLFALPPTAHQIEQETAEARLKVENRDSCIGLADYYGKKLAASQEENAHWQKATAENENKWIDACDQLAAAQEEIEQLQAKNAGLAAQNASLMLEQETAEACAKVCKALADCDENTEPYRQGASWCEEAIRSGAWKEQK